MTYIYACDCCGLESEVSKLPEHAGREELCIQCNAPLRRIYRPIGLNFMTLTPREKNDVTKYKLDTGRDLVCIGDDISSLQPKLSEYDLPPEVTSKFEG